MLQLHTRRELLDYVSSYKAIVTIGGFGRHHQYEDIDSAVRDTAIPLFEAEDSMDAKYGSGQWVAFFGGGNCDEANPDIALLARRLKRQYRMNLIAIEPEIMKDGDGIVDTVDAVYFYPTEYRDDGKIAWGGLKGGRPVGRTRVLLEVNPCSCLPLYWIATGGGDIILHELLLARDRAISLLFIQARPRANILGAQLEAALPYGVCQPFWDVLQELDTSVGTCGWRTRVQNDSERFQPRSGVADVCVLVTGATGLLGREVLREFEQKGWDVHGTGFSRATGRIHKCDLLAGDDFGNLLDQISPRIVIHCAAERRPQALAKNKDYAWKINVELSAFIAKTCAAKGVWVINVSTNYVFDGNNAPYAEDAHVSPLSVYGESKVEAEKAFAENHPDAFTVRIPLLYGPIEFLEETSVTELLTKIQKSPDAKLDNYQERYPTSTSDLCRVFELICWQYLSRGKERPDLFRGIFHWQANEMYTKYTMAVVIADIAGVDTSAFNRVDKQAYPNQQKVEGMTCDRLEALLSDYKGADHYRSSFKENMAQYMRPFLPLDRLAKSIRRSCKSGAKASKALEEAEAVLSAAKLDLQSSMEVASPTSKAEVAQQCRQQTSDPAMSKTADLARHFSKDWQQLQAKVAEHASAVAQSELLQRQLQERDAEHASLVAKNELLKQQLDSLLEKSCRQGLEMDDIKMERNLQVGVMAKSVTDEVERSSCQPELVETMQNERDALMLEVLELRKTASERDTLLKEVMELRKVQSERDALAIEVMDLRKVAKEALPVLSAPPVGDVLNRTPRHSGLLMNEGGQGQPQQLQRRIPLHSQTQADLNHHLLPLNSWPLVSEETVLAEGQRFIPVQTLQRSGQIPMSSSLLSTRASQPVGRSPTRSASPHLVFPPPTATSSSGRGYQGHPGTARYISGNFVGASSTTSLNVASARFLATTQNGSIPRAATVICSSGIRHRSPTAHSPIMTLSYDGLDYSALGT